MITKIIKQAEYIIKIWRTEQWKEKDYTDQEKDRMICGVCGGIAKYFNIDPTLVRLAFVLISMGAGSGVLAYIVAAIIIPDDPEEN